MYLFKSFPNILLLDPLFIYFCLCNKRIEKNWFNKNIAITNATQLSIFAVLLLPSCGHIL